MNVGVCGAGIFALLDCLPGMAFTLTLFRKRLRLGVRATVAVCALLVVIQVVAGSLRYRHVDDNAYMALMAILLPVLWGFPVIGLIRDSWRKIVFVLMLFMTCRARLLSWATPSIVICFLGGYMIGDICSRSCWLGLH